MKSKGDEHARKEYLTSGEVRSLYILNVKKQNKMPKPLRPIDVSFRKMQALMLEKG